VPQRQRARPLPPLRARRPRPVLLTPAPLTPAQLPAAHTGCSRLKQCKCSFGQCSGKSAGTDAKHPWRDGPERGCGFQHVAQHFLPWYFNRQHRCRSECCAVERQHRSNPSASTINEAANQKSSPSTSSVSSDQNATVADQSANGQKLPQTASPLPLLGLLGLGSLATGLISRRKK